MTDNQATLIANETAQIADIVAGLVEADAGNFATDQEIAAVLAKYQVKPAQAGITRHRDKPPPTAN